MPEGDGAEDKAAPQTGGKSQTRELVGTILYDLLWFGIDLWFIWPISRFAAVAFGLAALGIQFGTSSLRLGVRLSIVGGLAILAVLAFEFLPPVEDAEGLLIPGNRPDPPGDAMCQRGAKGGPVVYLGSTICGFPVRRVEHFAVIVAAGTEELLSIDNEYDGAFVSARVFDENGIIAKLVNNEFQVNKPTNAFRTERPDRSTLVVFDRFDRPVFRIEYRNRREIYVTGSFFYPGLGTLTVDDTGAKLDKGGRVVGTVASVANRDDAILNFGPGKRIDVGVDGVGRKSLARDWENMRHGSPPSN